MNKTKFKTIAIFGKYKETNISDTLELVFEVTKKFNCDILLDKSTISQSIADKYNFPLKEPQVLAKDSDLVISIGGDGSFLSCSRNIIKFEKPILGINRGRLGFLTDISPNQIHKDLTDILNGKYKQELRQVLSAKLFRNGKKIASNIAINDVIVHKTTVAKMVELDVLIDGNFLSKYISDGLIISTATGSTAYSLSAGGPILQGDLDAFVISPICPHTLTQRPIVVSANSKLEIKIPEQRNDATIQVTTDGQEELILQHNDIIEVSSHSKKLKIFHPNDYDGVKRLREKLGWGNS